MKLGILIAAGGAVLVLAVIGLQHIVQIGRAMRGKY